MNETNRRIAKNTTLLYLRIAISTIVLFYTARLTLRLLGVVDFGIYNVVSGIIGLMNVVTITMTSASQRFLSFDLGNNDIHQYSRTFSMLVNIFFLFGVLTIAVLEICGVYAINNILNIPVDRVMATHFVFQFSIVNFIIYVMNIPFMASIVAYERMDKYAYFTLFDVALKLLVVYALYVSSFDKLITLSALTLLSTFLSNSLVASYCFLRLPGCRYVRIWNKQLFSKLSGFAGWNMLGSLSGVLNIQGQAIVLNVFFGPIVNGAKAIADKINGIVSSFAYNFFMAVSPQIVKSYAQGNISYMCMLVLNSSRYAYALMLLVVCPVVIYCKGLLTLWLGPEEVTDEMVLFCQLTLIYALINVLELPISQAIRATGDLKKYQLTIGAITLTFIPICFIAFIMHQPAYVSMVILNAIYMIAHFFRVILVKPVLHISFKQYAVEVLLPVFLMTGGCIVLGLLMYHSDIANCSLLNLFIHLAATFIITFTLVAYVGVKKEERAIVISFIRKKFIKH